MVTCRDWAHLWLNEGFASFAEVLWVEHHEGPAEGAFVLVHKGRAARDGGKARPVVDRRYPSPGSMFDARAYPKGAWVLHMLRRRLGEEAFWKAVQRYGKEHRFQSVETSDFRKTLEQETGRNLERFFYDWTERPGHPVLEITTDYLPEAKQARVTVKQTQDGEAFHFPLTIEFQGSSASSPSAKSSASTPVVVAQEITEKEAVFFVPLAAAPTLVTVDPDQAILAEIKETKSRELWLKQLHEDRSVAARIRAAEHFGQSKTPADREALAKALSEEKFWGVQAEIAAALGTSGGDASRDALIAGLKQKHPKVRRACAEQLGKFRHDAPAAKALKEVLQKGDASYFVEAAALTAYAKVQPADTVAVLLPWLAKPSYHEILHRAVLEGLGEAGDLSGLDTLTAWTKRGKPRTARLAALAALARLARTAAPKDEPRQQIVAAVAACLEGETPPVRRAAVTALRELGRSAETSLTALEALRQHDPDDRVRDLAQRAIEQIRANAPVPVELTRLREELEQLRRAQEALRQRPGQVERK
jgi:aminopeptidase N